METEHVVGVADARDLSQIADESIDLVLTSPPYPMIGMWDESFAELDPALSAGDLSPEERFRRMHGILDGVWRECYRVLRPGRMACINIGDATRTVGENFRLYTNQARITAGCEALGFQSLPPILWWKPTNAPNKFMGSGMLPGGAYVTQEHEYILLLRKGDKARFTGAEARRRRRSAYFWEERNSWFSDIWDLRGIRQKLPARKTRERSGAFPFELAFRLIAMFSLYEDTVLDPFLGTGTTAAAALAAGRNSVGVERDPALFPTIRETLLAVGGAAGGSGNGGASEEARERQAERLRSHRAFVAAREAEGRELQYRNGPHDLPVMTRQERELEIHGPAEVSTVRQGSPEPTLQVRARHELLETGDTAEA